MISVSTIKKSRIDILHKYKNGIPFGKVTTDHMFFAEYYNGKWQHLSIIPHQDITLSPNTMGLHYGQCVFEGMKAFYANNNQINLFRPLLHFNRLKASCIRMCIPTIEPEIMLDALVRLIKLDYKWVPKNQVDTHSLYIRPVLFASESCLSARISNQYRCYITLCVAEGYYSKRASSFTLITSHNYTRATQGGVGNIKTGGNYGASFYPTEKAKKMGYAQILWLDSKEHKYLEEIGTMNVFLLINDTLITPSLRGTILPGITRSSILTIANTMGLKTEERAISIDEVCHAYNKGHLKEIFGCGTAGIVIPVEKITHNNKPMNLSYSQPEKCLYTKIYNQLTAIQYGIDNKPPFDNWNITVSV